MLEKPKRLRLRALHQKTRTADSECCRPFEFCGQD
jgi:hypothetical protein